MRIAAGCSIHVSNIFAQIGRGGWHVIFFESLHQGHLIGCLLALAFQMEQLGSVCMSKVWLLTSCPIDRKRRLMQSVNVWCEVWIEKYVVMSLSVHVRHRLKQCRASTLIGASPAYKVSRGPPQLHPEGSHHTHLTAPTLSTTLPPPSGTTLNSTISRWIRNLQHDLHDIAHTIQQITECMYVMQKIHTLMILVYVAACVPVLVSYDITWI